MTSAPTPPASPSHPLRPWLARPIPISESTRLTRGMARGPGWRESTRGLYVPADLPAEHAVEQRILEASMLCPPGGAITGWAALRWLGGAYFGGTYAGRPLPVPIAVPRRGFRQRPGVVASWERVLPEEIVEVDGVPVTVPVYAAAFEARHAPHGAAAVEALDMALMFDLTSTEELIDFRLRRLFTTTGIAQLDASICLASENCWSPMEVTMRLAWEIELQLPRLLCNWPVFDLDGRHIGTPDLVDPVTGVVGEYDGGHHLEPGRPERDRSREAEFRRVGLEVVTMTVQDLPVSTRYLERVEAAYFRAQRRAGRPRGWTTDLPSYWVPTQTVAQRRSLTPGQRERFLGWQRLPVAGSHTRSRGAA